MLRGDAEGFCDGFDVEISVESDEPNEKISELIRLARKMCFTEKALAGSMPIVVRQTINGQEIA